MTEDSKRQLTYESYRDTFELDLYDSYYTHGRSKEMKTARIMELCERIMDKGAAAAALRSLADLKAGRSNVEEPELGQADQETLVKLMEVMRG